MSRTFRLRNLPPVPGFRTGQHAKKYIDAATRPRKSNAYWATMEAQNIPLNEKMILSRAHDRDNPEDVLPVYYHPWVGYGIARNSEKSYYKTVGNRKIRRSLKNLLNKWAFEDDDFEDALPGKLDGWSTWDLW